MTARFYYRPRRPAARPRRRPLPLPRLMISAAGEVLVLAQDLVDQLHGQIRAEALLGGPIAWTCEGRPCRPE